ncbi:hypothetical protein DJ568_15485 [Mucilaginibacter hurinus]|uniref:Uncharacterized protein n=1 Tax=Mucilaginibacter hurinus TaxID=2201324 RepID=A0A367GKU3_9SPHI|nr:SprB repeat-containing protein [Mucilaginibacter hurinus]RCH53940.1 hypothetical protein DJ568_15485 [Mucilaginibacter hurinus]
MSYILIDTFMCSGYQMRVYQMSNPPYNILNHYEGPGGTVIDLNYVSHNRLTPEGALLRQACHGTTKVTVSAINTAPFAVSEVEYNSASCGFVPGGGCDLAITDVVVINTSGPGENDGQAEILVTGFTEGEEEDLEFSVDNVNWQSSNFFAGLPTGSYTAYVRDQGARQATKPFKIFQGADGPLVIRDIKVTNETGEGTHDGSATITATGLNTPFTYSLNNIHYQSSNVLTALAPGTYTSYVKDAGGVIDQQQFSVGQFTGFVLATPAVQVAQGNVSRWSAAFNPVIFKFRRRDFMIQSIGLKTISSVQYPELLLDTIPAKLQPGSDIYVYATNYTGTFTVKAVAGNAVVIDAPYIADSGTGYVIANAEKPNYRLELVVSAGLQAKQFTGVFSNDNTGLIVCQLQSRLKTFLATKNSFLYNTPNMRDVNAAVSYTVKYREVWDDHAPAYTPLAETFYCTNAAKQLQDVYGGNMARYVPFLAYPPGNAKAKFLTLFTRPTLFAGYPFDFSFIYAEQLADKALKKVQRVYNVNKQVLPYNTLLVNENSEALYYDDVLLYNTTAQPSVTTLAAGTGIHRVRVDTLEATGSYGRFHISYKEGAAEHIVTETKEFLVDGSCRKNPVYLCWLNTLGGWDYWLFDSSQKVDIGISDVKTFDKYIEDYERADVLTETVSKTARTKITLGANSVLISEIEALKGIMYSPKVLLLTGQGPVKWMTVQVDSGSFDYETKHNVADIELSIMLPVLNIQTI